MLRLKDEWYDACSQHVSQVGGHEGLPDIQAGTGLIDILLVQHSLTQAEQQKYLLEMHGYRADIVLSGVEALRYLETHQPAIVICDVVLAESDGYTLCQHIKTDERYNDIRVLLTSASLPDDIIAGLNCGADSFLCQPYSDELLLGRLKDIQKNRKIRKSNGAEVYYAGRKYALTTEHMQPVDLLLATYETAVQKTHELDESHRELRQAYEATIILESTLHMMLERNADAIFIVGLDGGIRYVNPAAAALFNRSRQELVDTRFSYPLEPESTYQVAVVGLDGMERLLEVRVTVTNWEREEACLVSMRDVSDRMPQSPQTGAATLIDELTGLFNSRGFLALAEQKRREADQNPSRFSLLVADIESVVVHVNTFGYSVHDRALTDTAGILREAVRDSDIVARMTRDRFAMIILGVTPASAEAVLARIRQALDRRNAEEDRAYTLMINFGVEHYDPEQACSIQALLERIDCRTCEEMPVAQA